MLGHDEAARGGPRRGRRVPLCRAPMRWSLSGRVPAALRDRLSRRRQQQQRHRDDHGGAGEILRPASGWMCARAGGRRSRAERPGQMQTKGAEAMFGLSMRRTSIWTAPLPALSPQQAAARRRESRELPAGWRNMRRRNDADLLLLAPAICSTRRLCTARRRRRCAGTLGETDRNAGVHRPGKPRLVLQPQEPLRPAGVAGKRAHLLSTGRVESVELPELGAVVHGAAFTAPEQTRSLLAGFHAPRDGRVHLMPCSTARSGPRGPVRSPDPGGDRRQRLAYLALGHIHRTRRPGPAGGRWRPGPAARRAAALTSWGSGEFYEGCGGRTPAG
jgi:hypothetical protein